jgi:heme exporter protein B
MAAFWWIVQKDLVSEFRARRVWPAALLLGSVVALLIRLQIDLPAEYQRQTAGGLLWLAVLVAAGAVFERALAAEREDGCWDSLQLLPVSAEAVFLAKLAVNIVTLTVLELLLIPLFFALWDLPLLVHAHQLAWIALLANPALAAVGTLLGGLAAGGGKGGSLLVLAVLPLVVPVMLAASEATRLVLENRLGDTWLQWLQFLGACGVVFVTAGVLLFGVAIED